MVSVLAVRLTAKLTTCILAALSALHVAWAIGSAFPFRSRHELANAVVGTEEVPSPMACVAVAGALATGAALTADALPIAPTTRRSALRTMAVILGVRGALGLFGKTEALSPGSNSPRFIRLDRRFYSPLCLLLSCASVALSWNWIPERPSGGHRYARRSPLRSRTTERALRRPRA